jgi:extradiol dioxygenase family protein
MSIRPFHIAIPVHDIKLAREFYGGMMALEEGRRDEDLWQDYNFYGHQLVCHYVGNDYKGHDFFNKVSNDEVPVPHFGIVLNVDDWHKLK